jgi:hypothetical protein
MGALVPRLCLLRFPRVKGGDAGVSLKVPWVAGKDSVDPVDLHPSRKSSVVNLNSLYFVLDEEPSPFWIDRRRIVQERQNWIKPG